jgi:hypothetical protein
MEAVVHRLPRRSVPSGLPVHPAHRMGREITADGGASCRKERRLSKPREKPESLQLVLDGILHLGHAQLDASRVQGFVELGQHVGRGHVHAGDGLCRNDQPVHRRRRCSHCVQRPLMEQLGVGEKQGRIPAKQDQPRDESRVRIARDVMVALDALGASQNRGVWAPAIPQEFDDGNRDGEADALDRAQHRHADCTDDR